MSMGSAEKHKPSQFKGLLQVQLMGDVLKIFKNAFAICSIRCSRESQRDFRFKKP
jgi:hypothetical protein